MVRSLKELYDLLRSMIIAVQTGNKEEVLRLNSSFDAFAIEIFGNGSSNLGADYNNCRQYCIATINEPDAQKKKQYIDYAIYLFSKKIPAPKR